MRTHRPPTTGIVLAGGRSSRFSSGAAPASKLDADLGGESVLDRSIAAVAAIADEVVVVGRRAPTGSSRPGARSGAAGPTTRNAAPRVAAPRAAAPRAAARAVIRHVPDREPFGGPVAGLLAGLEAGRGEVVVATGGDMPLLVPDVLRLLIDRLTENPDIDATLLAVGDAWQPLPLAMRRRRAGAAARAALETGDRSLLGFVRRLHPEVISEAEWRRLDPTGDSLRDVDTLADLEDLRRRL